MKKIIFIIIACMCLGLSGCIIPRHVTNAFTYCYTNTYTGIDTLINIDGYYSGYPSMIFYDNGLVVGSFSHYNDSNKPPLFLKEIIENPDAKNSKPFYLFADCGGYIICGDTIKIQMIDNCRFNDEYRCGKESWYKIVNKDTLLFLVSFLITTDQKEKEYWGKHYPLKGGWTRTFNSISIKPLLDYYWILKEKWFWCNTNDWKDYMAKIKQKKQKRGN